MTESFLHYIWQHQYFKTDNLSTTDGRLISILFPGFHNQDSGPDFFQSRIRMADLEWVGAVEIHLKSSDYLKHHHHSDHAYGIVILHVVWQHDLDIFIQDGFRLPVLELHRLIPEYLVERYGRLMKLPDFIQCKNNLSFASSESIYTMIGQAAASRMEDRKKDVESHLVQTRFDWLEVHYRLIARSFGLKVNGQAFLRLSELLPLRRLLKIRGDRFRLEAILFGVAGFLDTEPLDDYQGNLKKEFFYQQKLFEIRNRMKPSEWKFMRMRPVNFPTMRLAQFAALIDQAGDFLSRMPDFRIAESLEPFPWFEASEYWKWHYRFGIRLKSQITSVSGYRFISHYFINVWVPLMLFRAEQFHQPEQTRRIFEFLQKLPAERNAIMRQWAKAGISASNALESQGLLHQYQCLCRFKKCLDCEVGMDLLGRPKSIDR